MPGLGRILKVGIASFLFKQVAFSITPPSSLFFSLHSGDPGDIGSNELSTSLDSGYTRTEVGTDSLSPVNFSDLINEPPNILVLNLVDIAWPKSQGAWNGGSPIPFWGMWSALTSGTCYMTGFIGGVLPEITSAGRIFSAKPGQMMVRIGSC